MKNKLLLLAMGVALSAQSLMAQIPSYVPSNGLVAYYPFNGNANDVVGNNNGTINGATLTTGKLGNTNSAYLFNGTSNNIGLSQPFLGGNQVGTFSFYSRFKTSGTPTNVYNIWGKAFFWGEVNICVNSENKIDITWANSNNGNTYSQSVSTGSIVPNSWNDIVITFENSNIKIYLNGTQSAASNGLIAQGGSVLSTTFVNSLCNFAQDANSSKIGSRINGGVTGNFFSGTIDDIGVWNRALTPAEAETLFNGGQVTYSPNCNNVSGSLTQGLVGYWPFCGNANDDSGNGNNGTVNGATLTTDRFGNANSAYSFNGVNNFISVPSSTSISPLNSLTLSCWVYVNNSNAWNQFVTKRYSDNISPFNSYIIAESNNSQGDNENYTSGIKFINNDVILNDNNPLPINVWYNYVLVYNGSTMKLYRDGILVNSISASGEISYSNLPLYFGSTGLAGQCLNGKLDDIGIWNRALTPAEISQLYNQNQCFTNTTVTDTLVINVGQLSYTNPVTYSNNITIAPNPASTEININFNNITNLAGGSINIINSLGQPVATTPITATGTQTTMQLSVWGGTGMYFVQIINAQGQIVDIKKIILQ